MTKIVRTPTKATGGITEAERAAMAEHTKVWIARAFRTEPIDPTKIVPAIKGLYAAASLKEPRVVIVESPLVMAFAYGAAAAIWYRRKNGDAATSSATRRATLDATDSATRSATYGATDSATSSATYDATRSATCDATDSATCDATDSATSSATYDATRSATYGATSSATYGVTFDATDSATDGVTFDATDSATDGAAAACYEIAGRTGLDLARYWGAVYQGGNMWASYDCYLTAARDILGLRLPEHEAYALWEQAAIEGGFRVMHEEFCIVSDFPEIIKMDAEGRPHCEDGPSHRWRDGWSLYHWHGVRIPAKWIEDRASLTPQIALTWANIEQRRAACEIIGWPAILTALDARVINEDGDPEIGTLIEVDLPDAGKERFLRVLCGTGREFALPVPPEMATALEAQAWTWGLDGATFTRPEIRT